MEVRLRSKRTRLKPQPQHLHPLPHRHPLLQLLMTVTRTRKRMPRTTARRSQFHQAPTFCQKSLNIFSTTMCPTRTSPAASFTTTPNRFCTTKRIFLATPMTKSQKAWTNQRWRNGTGQYPKSTTQNRAFVPSLHPIFQSGSNELVAVVSGGISGRSAVEAEDSV